jgi:hypothetical protein
MNYKCRKNPYFSAPATLRTLAIKFIATVTLLLSASAAAWADSATFVNTNTIIINGGESPPVISTPYPSSITVTGLTGQVVLKVTITLSNFSHSFPSDVDALLVGPQGQMTFPMSEVGGFERYPVTNITLTIDDDAAQPLPLDAPLTTGTFQPNKLHPTNYYDMPLPAPAGNSNAPAMMSMFKGTNPNGIWNLYVVEDSAEDSGIISNGWSLSITSGVLLNINQDNFTNVILSWTNSAIGYTLQTAPDLVPPAEWNDVAGSPGNVGGQFTMTNPITASDAFYRLIKH